MSNNRLPELSSEEEKIIQLVREFEILLLKPMFILRMASGRTSGAATEAAIRGATTQILNACREIDSILQSYPEKREAFLARRGRGPTRLA